MSIEGGATAPASAKVPAGAENHGVRGKHKTQAGSGQAEGPAAGGFLALLTALEPESESPALQASPDPLLPSADPGAAPGGGAWPTLPAELAMLLAQAGEVAGDAAEGPSVGPVGSGGRTVRQAAPTTGMDHMEKPDAPVPGAKAANNPLLSREVALESTGPAPVAKAPKVAAGLSGAGDARASSLAWLTERQTREPVMSGGQFSTLVNDAGLRLPERAVSKAMASDGGAGGDGSLGLRASPAGSGTDTSAVIADPSAPSFESVVADTVNYWVSQGIQNAELKLDGLGHEPVEVTISLKGDEASIGFRTDQPEIRQVLEGAAAQLKELLSSEGLVLSGLTIGTSAQQQGSGTQERRNRGEVRQVSLIRPEVVQGETPKRMSQSVGRAVDLFV